MLDNELSKICKNGTCEGFLKIHVQIVRYYSSSFFFFFKDQIYRENVFFAYLS